MVMGYGLPRIQASGISRKFRVLVHIHKAQDSLIPVSREAVSYTHLDVYKRQPLTVEKLVFSEETFSWFPVLAKLTPGWEKLNSDNTPLLSVRAVSYFPVWALYFSS